MPQWCAAAALPIMRHLELPEPAMSRPNFRFTSRRSLVAAALAGAAVLAAPSLATAQAYPNKPITLIVPWPAGGSTDRHLRGLAEIASRHLGQPVVVNNQPGAGGTLGPGSMALNAKPDGYTIAQFPMGMLRIPHMQKQQWHPLNDFSFILGISGYTFGFVVKGDAPFKSFNDYVEAARKAPGAVNYGSTGNGTSPHLLMEEVAAAAKVQLTHVPYKGNADLMQSLMNVPTAKDLGYGVVSSSPYGLVGPKGMDPAVVKTLHDAFKKAMDDPKHLELLEQLNQDLWYRSGEDYAKWAAETFARDKALIERLGLAAK